MKKLLLTISFSLFSLNVFSVGGVGDTVSDPISYTYYVEKIKKTTAMIAEQKRNVESVLGLQNLVAKQTEELRGAYDNALGVVRAVGGLAQEVKGIPESIEIGKRNFNDIGEDYERYAQTDENLRIAFNDPRSSSFDPYLSSAYRYNIKQLDKKNVIRAATEMLNKQTERIENLQEISGKIDKTTNIKDAADLGNRFLAELVKGQLEILAVLSRMAKMQALQGYTGYEEETANAEVDKQEARKPEKDMREWKFTEEVLSYDK
jgi:hypothetical protein